MAEFESEGGLRIVEHHSPVRDLLLAYPIVARLESEMFQKVLRAPVQRDEQNVSGLFCCTFSMKLTSDMYCSVGTPSLMNRAICWLSALLT